MELGSRRVRLKTVWLLIIPFLILARPTPALIAVGAALTLVGIGIRGWAAGLIKKDRELTVSGPYAYTRNPLYLGSFFIGLGVTIAGGRWYFVAIFLAFFFIVYRHAIGDEEENLAEQFGDAYERYRDRVPFFFPRLTPYRPGSAEVEVPAAAETPSAAGARFDQGEGSGGWKTWGFSLDRYLRNKEWEAGLGVLAGFGVLTAKLLWGG